MAPQAKKKNKPSTIKKKPARKKTAARTKKRKPSKGKRNFFLFLVLVFMVGLVSAGYFWGQNDSAKTVKPSSKAQHNPDKKAPKKTKHDLPKKSVPKVLKKKPQQSQVEVLKKEEPVVYEENVRPKAKALPSAKGKVALAYRGKRPRLVIVIDDVHTRRQLNAIQSLNMSVTPSLFPPYKLAPKNHLLAQGLQHYMVHLPMESGSRKFNKQWKTLMVSSSEAEIVHRVKEIRVLFPTAKYVNNHTGSVFTSNEKAMDTLYRALRKEGFVFIDSMTSSRSKVGKIAHRYGDAYVARDTFIDNVKNIKAIQKQLKHAVKLAKKNGYALVIGHPYPVTLEAIKQSKGILKEVDLVYIDAIYR